MNGSGESRYLAWDRLGRDLVQALVVLMIGAGLKMLWAIDHTLDELALDAERAAGRVEALDQRLEIHRGINGHPGMAERAEMILERLTTLEAERRAERRGRESQD